jgi:hypothetical protein
MLICGYNYFVVSDKISLSVKFPFFIPSTPHGVKAYANISKFAYEEENV